MEDTSREIFSELIEDLYAECEERLGFVHHDLLALEAFVDKPLPDKALFDALLRHLHTLKGLAGTINLTEGEQLAHRLENYLRTLKQGTGSLSTASMDVLVAGTEVLERVITAHHTQAPLPDITSMLAVLTDLPRQDLSLPECTTTISPSSHPRLWRFEFVPNPTLAEQGINVNLIRQRLENIGKLIEAKPTTNAQGDVVFEFLVATEVDETSFVPWQSEGVTYRSVEESTAPVISPKMHSSVISTISNVVRVDMSRLDGLMQKVGELMTSRARQENLLKQFKTFLSLSQWRALQETNLDLERQLRDLREGVMRVRMVPIGSVFERMRFVVRDLVRGTSKQIKLELSGQETEIDKLMVDQMMDPILHLVRNAVSHGIEPPPERVAQGKPAEGKITLRAGTAGDAVVIEIEDDGRGIDLEKVTIQACNQGLLETGMSLDSNTLLELLCQPGFSTQKNADLTSGRGVGMDVVKNTVNALGGFINLETQAGVGTHFTIQLPLTLAIVDALIVSVGQQRFAVPQLSIREVLEIASSAVVTLENNQIFSNREGILVLLHLAHLFNLEEAAKPNLYVLVAGGATNVGIVVERILGEREIVVRALQDPLVHVQGISGATDLGDGKVILILDIAALVKVARGRH